MKRIVFITDRVMHYQIATFRALAEVLHKNGLELWLLSGRSKKHETGRNRVAVQIIDNEAAFGFHEHRIFSYTFRRYSGVIKKIKDMKPCVVVNSAHCGNYTHWRIGRLKKKVEFKLVSWLCGYEFNASPIKRRLLNGFIPLYDHHLAYHSNARSYALAHGAQSAQVTVVHNTIDEAAITVRGKEEARAIVCRRHPEIADRKIVLFVGAILREKRIEEIFEALDLMRRPDVVLVIVGDGEHMATIRDLSAKRSDVVLTGAVVEGVGCYFDAAHVYVLPGTGGLGINEAMAHGLPVISGFADGSADDLIIDGVNGFRLGQNVASEMATGISKLVNDVDLARSMGEKSRELIRDRFAFRHFIDRVAEQLTRLAA